MSAYIVATIAISDHDRFAAYAAGIQGLAASFGGEPIVKGPVAAFLEGTGPAGERVVVTRFPDAQAARGYIDSAAYQAAAALREGAASVTMRLVEA